MTEDRYYCRECGAGIPYPGVCAACVYYREAVLGECPEHGRGRCDC